MTSNAERRAASPRRERSPRGQGSKLRADVLTAVARLLDKQVENPDLNLSLREVARETGIAVQSLYLHFPGKESLALAAATDGYQRLVAAMRHADRDAADAGRLASARLRAQAHAFCAFAADNQGVFRLMFGHDASRLDPGHPGHPGSQLWRQWLSAVHACEAEGYRWTAGAERTALHLWSALLGHYALAATTFPSHNQLPPSAFVEYITDTLLTEGKRD